MKTNGVSLTNIADVLERSPKAVGQKLWEMKQQAPRQTPQTKLKFTQENKPVEAKYTRYLEPKREVSILWGLIKYTK